MIKYPCYVEHIHMHSAYDTVLKPDKNSYGAIYICELSALNWKFNEQYLECEILKLLASFMFRG